VGVGMTGFSQELAALLARDALAGVRILAVDDEADALEVVAEGLPQVDGFAVLKGIREDYHSLNARALAIALTAHASQADRQRSLAAGFGRHLSKPYDLRELIDAILTGQRERYPEQTCRRRRRATARRATRVREPRLRGRSEGHQRPAA
jgi:DNA-binding response OmpR family regulator